MKTKKTQETEVLKEKFCSFPRYCFQYKITFEIKESRQCCGKLRKARSGTTQVYLIYPRTWLENLEFLLYNYVCYSDLPTEVNKILPLVSLHDGLSPEGSAWLCSQVLTSCVSASFFFFFFFTHLTLPHRECW